MDPHDVEEESTADGKPGSGIIQAYRAQKKLGFSPTPLPLTA
jgi:hypothetical protein